MAYDLAVIDRYFTKFRRVGTSIFVEIVDSVDNSVKDTTEFSNAGVAGPIPGEVSIFARNRLSTFIAGSASGGGAINTTSDTSVVGDSRFAYGFPVTSVGLVLGVQSMNPIMHANDLLAGIGRGFDFRYSWTLGGDTFVTSMASGRWASFLADGCAIGHMMFGHNDMNPAGTVDYTPQKFIDMYIARLDEACAVKKVVFVWSMTPIISSVSTTFLNQWYSFPAINARLKAECARRNNAIYVDAYNALLDPTSLTLDPVVGYVQDDDGVHFTSRGGNAIGNAVAASIADKVIITPYKTMGANILPAFTGTGGAKGSGMFTVTNPTNVPLNWEIIATGGVIGTTAVVTRIDGNRTRVVLSNVANASTACTISLRPNSAARAAMLAQLNANGGESIQAAYAYNISDITGPTGVLIGGYVQLNGTNDYALVMGGKNVQENETTLAYQLKGTGGRRLSPVYDIPAMSITAVTMSIDVLLPVNTGACTIDIWDPMLYKLT